LKHSLLSAFNTTTSRTTSNRVAQLLGSQSYPWMPKARLFDLMISFYTSSHKIIGFPFNVNVIDI
jgi:hypothetical protein